MESASTEMPPAVAEADQLIYMDRSAAYGVSVVSYKSEQPVESVKTIVHPYSTLCSEKTLTYVFGYNSSISSSIYILFFKTQYI